MQLKENFIGKTVRSEIRSTKGSKSANVESLTYLSPDGVARGGGGVGKWWVRDDDVICWQFGANDYCFKSAIRGNIAYLYTPNGVYVRPADLLDGERK